MEFSNMADIFTQITDITKDIIDSRTTKVLKTESSRYNTFPPESGFNQIVIRPLSQLISLPMETKRYIFSDAYKDQKKNLNPDTPVRKILDVATEFVTRKYGKSRSKRWRDKMYDLMNQIVRIEGIKGLFSGSRAIIEIRDSARENDFEIDEELFFIFHNYRFKIGDRSIKYGEPVDLLQKWIIFDDYAELFSILGEVYNNQFYKNIQQISDIFVWSDSSIDSFQESFVKHTISHAINSIEPRANYRGIIVMIVSISSDKGIIYPNPNAFERLCLQRAVGGSSIIYSPSKDQIKSNVMDSRAVTLERLEETDFFTDLEMRIVDVFGEHSQIFGEGILEIVHESTQQLINKSSFSIISNTWNATWRDSLEIDGEHIMF